MKRVITNAGYIALLLSIGISIPGRVALPQQNQYQHTCTISAHHYPAPNLYVTDIWAEWIRLFRRSRRRHPPEGRRHLTKKQRQQLRRLRRRHLHRLRRQRRRCLRLFRYIEVQATLPSTPRKRRRRRRKTKRVQIEQKQVEHKQADHQVKDPFIAPNVESETGLATIHVEANVSSAQPVGDLPDSAEIKELLSMPRYGRKDVEIHERRIYYAELEVCPLCNTPLKKCEHLSWRKTVQTLNQNLFVGSRGSSCPHHSDTIYLSAAAARLSLPKRTYGLDVLVRIGYLRDYARWTPARIHQNLPDHIKVSTRHIPNLYNEYLALLACAERLDVEELRDAVRRYGGLILSIDGLEPEGGQPQLWVVREVLTGTLIAAGWIPRVDENTLKAFLKPVADLNLPILTTLSDKQSALIKALDVIWKDVPHQYCQAHYLSNAVGPLYQANEHMKTQLRKKVRAGAGATMREAQAQAKRNASGDGPSLIVTGLAAHPPAELANLKDQVTATSSAPDTNDSTLTDRGQSATCPPPDVIVRKRQPPRAKKSHPSPTTPSDQPPTSPVSNKQARIDKVVVSYAARLRNVLSRMVCVNDFDTTLTRI